MELPQRANANETHHDDDGGSIECDIVTGKNDPTWNTREYRRRRRLPPYHIHGLALESVDTKAPEPICTLTNPSR